MYFWKRFVCISMVECICLLAGCGQAGQADSKKREIMSIMVKQLRSRISIR